MTKFVARYLSFEGRLARLPFFIRGIYLGILATLIFFASIPLFLSGAPVAWWAGIGFIALWLALFVIGSISLIVRRLHDLGLSGYHAIWVGGAQAIWIPLSYAPPKAMFAGIPFAAVCLWLSLWPGNRAANRYDLAG